MTIDAKVCIITPVYATEENNRVEYLRQTYDCIASLKYKDYLWLVVDDGGPIKIADAFPELEKNEKVRLITRNRSPDDRHTASNAINAGLEKFFCDPEFMKIPYVTVLHSDDLMVDLEERVKILDENENAGLVFAGLERFNNSNETEKIIIPKGIKENPRRLRRDVWPKELNYQTMMWRREFMQDINGQLVYDGHHQYGIWDSLLSYGEDKEVCFQSIRTAMKKGWDIQSIPVISVKYRVHSDTITGYFFSHFSELREDRARVLKRHWPDMDIADRLITGLNWKFVKMNLLIFLPGPIYSDAKKLQKYLHSIIRVNYVNP